MGSPSKSDLLIANLIKIKIRLAGIEEDEDLLTACVSDVRSLNNSRFYLFSTLFKPSCCFPNSKLEYGRDAVDKDGDGDISKEEFVKNAMNSKFIHNMLKG